MVACRPCQDRKGIMVSRGGVYLRLLPGRQEAGEKIQQGAMLTCSTQKTTNLLQLGPPPPLLDPLKMLSDKPTKR